MVEKIKKALITEKIPAILCAMACIASAFMGFVFGYIFLGLGEPILAYGETPTVYQAGVPYLAVNPTLECPVQAPAQVCDEPATEGFVTSHIYIVTLLGGYIAIYHAEENGGGLKEVTSISVGNLDLEEQAQLLAGIKIYSDEALALILQDYGS